MDFLSIFAKKTYSRWTTNTKFLIYVPVLSKLILTIQEEPFLSFPSCCTFPFTNGLDARDSGNPLILRRKPCEYKTQKTREGMTHFFMSHNNILIYNTKIHCTQTRFYYTHVLHTTTFLYNLYAYIEYTAKTPLLLPPFQPHLCKCKIVCPDYILYKVICLYLHINHS